MKDKTFGNSSSYNSRFVKVCPINVYKRNGYCKVWNYTLKKTSPQLVKTIHFFNHETKFHEQDVFKHCGIRYLQWNVFTKKPYEIFYLLLQKVSSLKPKKSNIIHTFDAPLSFSDISRFAPTNTVFASLWCTALDTSSS